MLSVVIVMVMVSVVMAMRRAQFDGFPVRRMPVRVGPFFFARRHRRGVGQSFFGDEAFERGEPVMVVARSVVVLAALGGRLDFVGERGRPLLPREIALL